MPDLTPDQLATAQKITDNTADLLNQCRVICDNATAAAVILAGLNLAADAAQQSGMLEEVFVRAAQKAFRFHHPDAEVPRA